MTKTLTARPEHKGNQTFEAKHKTIALLTGVSASALMLGVSVGQANASHVVISGTKSSVTKTTGDYARYIDVNGGFIAGDLNNQGNVGTDDTEPFSIGVHSGGRIGGDLINGGTLSATRAGISITGATTKFDPVGGMILNSGQINVSRTTITKPSSAYGILISGAAVNTSVSNTGNLSVGLTAIGTGHTVGGVVISSGGNIVSNITNSGNVIANGTGIGLFIPTSQAQMFAVGLGVTNTAPGSTANSVMTNSSGGTIVAGARAIATGPVANATATAVGAGVILGATSMASVSESLVNSSSANITANASATVFNSFGAASAFALGAGQIGVGGASITQNVSNAGSISGIGAAVASGFGSFLAQASGFGVTQFATGAATVTQTVNNSGLIRGAAAAFAAPATGTPFASVNASAFAIGVSQNISGGVGTISNSQMLVNGSSGTIDVDALALGFGTLTLVVDASGFGVYQSSNGAGSHSLAFNNSGLLDVDVAATGIAASQANVMASGNALGQFAFGGTGSVALALTNAAGGTGTTAFTGTIDVDVFAGAGGFSADATVSAPTAAITQSVTASAGANVTVDITNQGSMSFNYTALAVGTNPDAGSDRHAAYRQNVNGTADSVIATIFNGTGANFTHAVVATASGPGTAQADVTAIGGWQTLNASTVAVANFTNHGTFNVTANANAIGGNATANASAQTGVYQAVSATGGAGSSAAANFTNTSFLSFNLNATAHATGSTYALATANIQTGVGQYVDGETALASINNSGAINMNVSAVANNTGVGNASAFATIDTAFSQTAEATGGQLSATGSLVNSGDINLTAFAWASGTNNAVATAELQKGLFQDIDNADVASASFTNTTGANFNISLTATAIGTDAFAKASNSNNIIGQFVDAGDDDVSASASILNDGTISVIMNALAMGTNGTGGPGTEADAQIELSYAFQQSAFDGANTTVSMVNNGSIIFDLQALATNASNASATFNTFDTVFYMSASANGGADDTVAGIFTNTGLIDINLNATANGVTNADASADLNYFLLESIEDASTATWTVTNSASGVISLDLVANASAPGGEADATAALTSFMELSATADAGNQALASVSVLNDGMITVNLTANAIGSTKVDASAEVSYGFYLIADDGATATVDLVNNGTIIFDLNAFAMGSNVDATATFDDSVIFMSADAQDGSTNGDLASVTLTNSNTGVFMVNLNATAIGTNGTGMFGGIAEVWATVDTLIDQSASDADVVDATFANAGTFTVMVHGLASNVSDASVSLSMGTVIEQTANAHSSPNSTSSTVNVINSGIFSVSLVATALGVTTATATVEFDDEIIYQSADGAGEAHALFDNSGTFSIIGMAFASALSGGVDATVSFNDEFLEQYAFADDGTEMNASAIFNNSGNLTLLGSAHAVGATKVTASVTFDDTVFYQSATADNGSGGATATVEFNNTATGDLDFQLVAKATGTDAFASASYTSYLFYQTADAADGASASVSVTNDGTMNFVARATAIGIPTGTTSLASPAPSATAEAYFDDSLIYQDVQNAVDVDATITNNGTMNFIGIALASNASDAQATVEFGYGFQQNVDVSGTSLETGGTADATIVNTSSLSMNFIGMAQAIGITSASASAEFDDTIIYQTAEGETATATIDNSGAINIDFVALATAAGNGTTGYAFAFASIDYGFSQNANANSNDGDRLFAGTYFNNSGSVSFNAVAMAHGTTVATATAYNDFGLYQFPDNADEVYAEFINDGSFTLNAQAYAQGSDVYAYASSKTIVSQSANPGDDNLSAEVLLVNNGTLSKQVRATAIGTDGSSGPGSTATATAYGGTGLRQYAYNGLNNTATINNNGDFNMSVTAIASNAFDVSANAYFDRAITQTAQAINTNGSTADATITNTSLTSFDININAKAVGVTDAYALASFTKTVVFQSVENAEVATALIDNSGAINVHMLAMATAVGNGTNGNATADNFLDYGFYQSAQANFGDQLSATATFNNSGIIDFNQIAMAQGTTNVTAQASQSQYLFFQGAYDGDTASATFTNTGTINQFLGAYASGGTNVDAYAYGNQAGFGQSFYQQVSSGDDENSASATFVNGDGATVDLQAIAMATGNASATSVYASADFFQYIILQSVDDGFNSSALIQNNGTFNVLAAAFASNPNSNGYAQAFVELESGIVHQSVDADSGAGSSASATLNNTSNLSLNYIGIAEAIGGTSVNATVSVEETYIYQQAEGAQFATVSLTNNGAMNLVLDAFAQAKGNGTTGFANASALVENGFFQFATNNGASTSSSASVALNNRESISIDMDAEARGTTKAEAFVSIETVAWQYAQGAGDLSTVFHNDNDGIFSVDLMAVAKGGTDATATAFADRFYQTVNPQTTAAEVSLEFNNRNSSSFVVDVQAQAEITGVGAFAYAQATALGASQFNQGVANQPVANHYFFNGQEDAFTNEPDARFNVVARATAAGGTTGNSANAYAEGFRVYSNTNSHAVLDITNLSNFRISAIANGSTAQATAYGMVLEGGELSGSILNAGDFNVRASAPGGSASAVGVQMNSVINNTVFTNTGNINVFALGSTTAVAVRYSTDTGHTIMATKSDHASFINEGGHIEAKVNSSGSIGFGTAFDLSNAPNDVTIQLQGISEPGSVWGNIILSPDDNIWVNNGMTYFAGMINPSMTFFGDLTVGSGGTLTLASTGTGPAVGYVDTFTNTASGTLAFNVTPSTPSTGLGQINAMTANLAGNVQLNVAPGLYANSQTYQDVVTYSTKNGTFDNALINSNTPLLSVQDIYPGDGTVDLALTRNAFNSVAGLTINQNGAASGIEGAYNTGLTGAFGSMVSSLFTLSTNAYIGALEQLHGAEHVQNLRTNLWSMDLLNYALEERINAGTFSNDKVHDRDSIIRRGELVLWGKYQGLFGDLEGDVEASGYEQRQNAFYSGFDYAISDDFLVGFAAGYYKNKLDFANGSWKKDEGVQLAIYGAYDTQTWYLRGNAALAYYDVESLRHINLPTQVGMAEARYNVNVFSFAFEGGRRFELSENVFFTPFVGLKYARAKNDAFSEFGATGANLALPENSVKSFAGEFGARLAAAFEAGSNSTISPEVSFRYRHEFDDEILMINSSFAGIANSGFSVISSQVDSGMFIANAGLTFTQGDKVEIRLTYTGRFNQQITDHGVGIRLSVLLGGRK